MITGQAVGQCPAGTDATISVPSCTSLDYDLQANVAQAGGSAAIRFEWGALADYPDVVGESMGLQSGAVITDSLSLAAGISTQREVLYEVTPIGPEECRGLPFQVRVIVGAPLEVTGCFACNNSINITLDENCEALLTLDEVAEGAQAANCVYFDRLREALEVIVYDQAYPDGNPANADATISGAGAYEYEVRLRPGYEACFIWEPCWGKVIAEDKTAPALVCPDDAIGLFRTSATEETAEAVVDGRPYSFRPGTAADVACPLEADCDDACPPPPSGFYYLICSDIERIYQVDSSYLYDDYPYFTGAALSSDCSAAGLVEVQDRLTRLACGADYRFGRQVEARIDRTFTFRDAEGNRAACTQAIYFFSPEIVLPDCEITLDLCDFPDLTTGNATEVLDPASILTGPAVYNALGERQPVVDGQLCRFSVAYEDEPLEGPEGCGIKLLRRWTFVDACRPAAGGCEDFVVPDACTERLSEWNGERRTYEQVLLVADEGGLLVSCPSELPVFSTGPFDCRAVVNPPAPVVGEACTDWSWEFELYGELTDPLTGIVMPGQLIGTSTDQVLAGVAPGKYELHYIVEDACGNRSVEVCPIEVEDQINPIAVCNEELNISLGGARTTTEGIARVGVEELDEGSRDNCGLTLIEARRALSNDCVNSYSELIWGLAFPEDFQREVDGQSVYYLNGADTLLVEEAGVLYTWWTTDALFFTCCDIGDSDDERVALQLRVTDHSELRNTCMLRVLIEDKLAPACTVADAAILCTDVDFDPADPGQVAARFGAADVIVEVDDNCGATIREVSTWTPGQCGAGLIERSFTVTDASGLTGVCTQRITVGGVQQYAVRFPADLAEMECGVTPIDTLLYGSDACDILAVTKDTARFDANGEACFKLFVTYSILNWCEYDGESTEPTTIPRDIDRDNQLEEYTWLEAGADAAFASEYLPGESEPFLVKLFGADASDQRNDLPERVLVRARCADEARYTGYRIWDRGANGRYELLCDRSIDGLCATESLGNQCWTPGFYEYTQVIKVNDNTAPIVEVVTDDFQFCAYGTAENPCAGRVDIAFSANDDCSPTGVELLSVALWLNRDEAQAVGPEDGFFEVIEVENTCLLTGRLPIGQHIYVARFSDGCGNVTIRRVDFSVIDCKAPAPICINGVAIELMPVDFEGDGIVDGGANTVRAVDLLASLPPEDCSGAVTYSINRLGEEADPARTSLTFTCDDPLFETIPIEVHAWDPAGNHDFCETFVVLEDLRELCAPSGAGLISGLVLTEEDEAVAEVEIQLSGQRSATTSSSDEGAYAFDELTTGYDYSVKPFRDGDYLNGVSTFDLVLISKHILSVRPLDSPYKLIAADANRSGSVTTLDLILLRKLILNISMSLPNNTSWRFVPLSFEFPDPANPFGYSFPEVLNVNNLAGELSNGDFVAIKVGDVNMSAVPNNLIPIDERSTEGTFHLEAEDELLQAGQTYSIALKSRELTNIQGFQATLHWQTDAVRLIELLPGAVETEHSALFPEKGAVTLSWFRMEEDRAPDVAEDSELFRVHLHVLRACRLREVLSIAEGPTPAEAYGQADQPLELALTFREPAGNEKAILYQNFPNPFRVSTIIGFELTEAGNGVLRLFDVNGRQLKVVTGDYQRGYNEVSLHAGELSGPGVYFYVLELDDTMLHRSLVLHD